MMDKIETTALIVVLLSVVGTAVVVYSYEFKYRPAHTTEITIKGITYEGEKLIGYQGPTNWQPNVIRVKKGDTVRLRIMSIDVPHGFAIIGYDVNTGPIEVGKSKRVEFVADKAGTFTFYCTVLCSPRHALMTGKLIVED